MFRTRDHALVGHWLAAMANITYMKIEICSGSGGWGGGWGRGGGERGLGRAGDEG